MSLIDKNTLLGSISPPFDLKLAEQLLDEYISMEKRFLLADYEPATLDGGQLCEAAARIIYHVDSGNLNKRKSVDACLKYVEDPTNNNTHNYPDRKSSLHLCRIIRSIYKFRSDRGAVHIDPDYTANHLDAKLVIDNSRWVLSELLRIFWTGDRSQVANTIKNLIQFDIPAIGNYQDQLLIQRIDCTTEEEILILLYHFAEKGVSRETIRSTVKKDNSGISKALKSLISSQKRQAIILSEGNYRITDLGIRRVRAELADKLELNN